MPPKNSTHSDAVRSATSEAKSFAIAASLTNGLTCVFQARGVYTSKRAASISIATRAY